MADLETIKDSLERCTHPAPFTSCNKCKFKGNPDDFPHCVERLAEDALALVNEMDEEIKRLRTQLDEAMLWR